MTCGMKCEDHILSLQTPEHRKKKCNYCGCASLQCVICSATYVCVCVMSVRVFEKGLWHMEGQRTQHWIILPLILNCLIFHILQPALAFLLLFSFIFSQHRSDADRRFRGERRERRGNGGGGGLLISFESECGIIICFLEGVAVRRSRLESTACCS